MEFTQLYIQEMISQKLEDFEILEAIDQLKEGKGNKFDINLVRSEFQKPIELKKGKWSPKSKFKNKEVLMISNGPNLSLYKKEIEKYIEDRDPLVISLKPKVEINQKYIQYYVACNPLRIMGEVDLYKKLENLLLFLILYWTGNLKQNLKRLGC